MENDILSGPGETSATAEPVDVTATAADTAADTVADTAADTVADTAADTAPDTAPDTAADPLYVSNLTRCQT